MFDIGFLELLIIGVVGLLVLGPERLPKAARTVGLWIGKIKRTVSGMQRDISAQLEAEELRQKLDEQQKKLDASLQKAKQGVERYGDADTATQDKATQDKASPQQTDDRARLDDALAKRREEASATSETQHEASATSDKDQHPR
ncbi:Sec-independent protein translocase protein TatB [Halomonas salinarum]|uniref:Sec-independent protein translocase protein TatB n=1 Tax=Halomonas salinarum TaxID=1158993 RepID=UPI00143C4AF1|nr:Sec-independent protein translocase protein TatB [Halomonas salinarum]